MASATPGSIHDLPTPALLLDLDVLEANLDAMQSRARSLGVRLRPHVKTHKCLEIGRMQRDRGARGITVATLEEARAFASHGFDDITWAFPVIPSRIGEVLEIREAADLAVTVDTPTAIEALERRAPGIPVWLQVDCGYGRAGVDPLSPAGLETAARLAGSDALEFRGCLTHSGHAYTMLGAERIRAIAEQERRVMVEFRERLAEADIDAGLLSVGSTPAVSLAETLEGVDEARPGNYALYDYTQTRFGACRVGDCALTVLGSIVSAQPDRERSIADCGALVMSKDTGPDKPVHYGRLFPEIEADDLDPDMRLVSVSQEHAIVSVALPVGSRIRVLPNHACLTVAQFDCFHVVRGNRVLDRWKIWRARGPGLEAA